MVLCTNYSIILQPMTTPERVVDVCDVPHELLRETSAQFTSLWDSDTRRRSLTAPAFSSDLNVSGSLSLCQWLHYQCLYTHVTQVYSKPCCIKSRYGAWYLPTSLWKVQKSDEVPHFFCECATEFHNLVKYTETHVFTNVQPLYVDSCILCVVQ